MFAEIQERVVEGRWAVVGGWWAQPDCNAPCGESFARQALQGQGFFRHYFRQTARVGYNVDTFGHSGMLPEILRLSRGTASVGGVQSERLYGLWRGGGANGYPQQSLGLA